MSQYFLPDFIQIQRQSFCQLLDKGLIEEFSKRNLINNEEKDLELYFYPQYYKLVIPEFKPREAILNSKSYTSKLFIPVQLTDKISKIIKLKWAYIGDLPLMTKRGHFILNGSARVIISQIIRSPGLYYQEKLNVKYRDKWSEKSELERTYKRSYVDIICLRGTWLRIELDKRKKIWAQTKRGPKIPIIWFLLGMGISEQLIFRTIIQPSLLFQNIKGIESINTGPIKEDDDNQHYITNPSRLWEELNDFILLKSKYKNTKKKKKFSSSSFGRQWLFNKFMNPKNYDLGKQGRLAINKKLGLNIAYNQLTLTPQDLLYAINHLIKVEKGIENIDDIDHLKNRRVRTSGELIQIQIGTGLIRLEQFIREKMNEYAQQFSLNKKTNQKFNFENSGAKLEISSNTSKKTEKGFKNTKNNKSYYTKKLKINNLISTKPLNSALREFFGSSPLSQFMDQINPLAEITHKRRLSSMGPGGVTRDTATLAIRGIHPTHYGRICPVETPEGKNTGLVNSLTTYSRVNNQGILESPFYKVYKGQVQKTAGIFFLSAEDEDQIKLAAADLFISSLNFLPISSIPVRIGEDFSKIPRHEVQYIGIAPIQMISIATSLIPFLEHDDANRALMGSNMQRQAVPLLRLDRPIVGTGLEGRAVSDSGHIIEAQFSGLVTYVSGQKITVTTVLNF
uniref:DNA-directed RNA polymerase n=1 Tax=Microglena monadina TaxID=47904 RepID=A0A0S2IBP9_9CHLO|nr:beta subunit of RNA polymerase [Microglena monadina]